MSKRKNEILIYQCYFLHSVQVLEQLVEELVETQLGVVVEVEFGQVQEL